MKKDCLDKTRHFSFSMSQQYLIFATTHRTIRLMIQIWSYLKSNLIVIESVRLSRLIVFTLIQKICCNCILPPSHKDCSFRKI